MSETEHPPDQQTKNWGTEYPLPKYPNHQTLDLHKSQRKLLKQISTE